MSVSLPPLNPLRAFEAAARLGSVSSAAKELNVTHGAISHQIRKLEAALKVTLLERGARRVKLTPHGAALLPTRSEEHTSELQSLMRISYAVFCLKKKNDHNKDHIKRDNRSRPAKPRH